MNKEEIIKQIEIIKHDIDICHKYNDYEDIGFYTSMLSDLKEQLKEIEKKEENKKDNEK